MLTYSEEGCRILVCSIRDPDIMERRVRQQISELCLVMLRVSILAHKVVPCNKYPGWVKHLFNQMGTLAIWLSGFR